jgi:hypothetical protein
MKLTFQELTLLCALAKKLGWKKAPENGSGAWEEHPGTYYWVDDLTHGIDWGFNFLRSRPLPGRHYEHGSKYPIWGIVFEPWNPFESLDDAWVLVEAIAPRLDRVGDGSMSLAAEFGLIFPPAIHRRSRGEAARAICLAAAKAWDIPTELVR